MEAGVLYLERIEDVGCCCTAGCASVLDQALSVCLRALTPNVYTSVSAAGHCRHLSDSRVAQNVSHC